MLSRFFRIFSIVVFFGGMSFAAGLSNKEVFEAVQAAADKATPESLRCKVVSSLVDAQLRQVPKDKIVYGQIPFVEMLFKKGYGFRLMVRNVDDYFVRLLGIYEPILAQSGLFMTLDKRNTFAAFSKFYEFSWQAGDEAFPNKVKVRERDSLPGDYGVYYYDKDWYLQKSEYFEANQLKATLKLGYLASGAYNLVSTFDLIVLNQKNLSSLSGKLYDFSFETQNAASFKGR